MFEKVNDLDEEIRILKDLDKEDEGNKTKRHMYRQFMYSEGEVRKIRLDYEKKIKKIEKTCAE